MPNDSEHHAFSKMTPNKTFPQDTALSFKCSRCVLIFKTRIYLYEHLHQVHGLSADTALKDSGLKTVPQPQSKPDINLKLGKSKSDKSRRKTEFAFNCKNCNFKSSNWSIYQQHKQQCSGTPNFESENTPGIVLCKPEISTGSKETKSEKAKHQSTSKDVKNYSKTPQTITNYFPAAATMKSGCEPNKSVTKTLHLEESPVNSTGVFQVTATSIDLNNRRFSTSNAHLLYDLNLTSDPTSAKPVDPFKEVPPMSGGKRMADDVDESSPLKKKKLEIEVPKLKTSASELSFEVSDDEENQDSFDKEAETVTDYFCKHCKFNTTDLMYLVSHYKDDHPYIKCDSIYIEEKSNQTAMFRCLKCPVEYSSEAVLCNHYKEDHPDAPEIFNLKLNDLVYRCFVCSFTSKILQSLKGHYMAQHPCQNVQNPLWYSKYSSDPQDVCSKKSIEAMSPETHGIEITANQSEKITESAAKLEGALYFCGQCPFNHKSVVVLHVHYKKCHPEEPITLDQIKQLVSAPDENADKKPSVVKLDISHSIKMEDISPVSDPEHQDLPLNDNADLRTQLDKTSSPSSSKKIFCCFRCNFSNSNVKSVISHHYKKHGVTTTIQEILLHTAEKEGKNAVPAYVSKTDLFSLPQNLFYCPVCNYGNPALLGVLNHQKRTHLISEGKDGILEHTAAIREQIEEAKSHPNDSILPSGLPLPVTTGDASLIFCHLCNYRHHDMHTIHGHYSRTHRGVEVTTEQINLYTSIVHKQLNASDQIKTTHENQRVMASKQKMDQIKSLKPVTEPEMETKFKCKQCTYSTDFLYRMRKHLLFHKQNLSFSDIVMLYAPGETFQPGYHCELCPFSDQDSNQMKRHGTDRHGRGFSENFLSNFLYLSPDICDPTNRGTSFHSDTTKVKKVSSKMQDKDKGKGAFDIYQEPLDFDPLNAEVKREKKKVVNCSYCPATFEQNGGLIIHMGMKHREFVDKKPPQEMAKRTQLFKCRHCSYVNNIKHGVASHCLRKHSDNVSVINSIDVESENLQNVEIKVKNGSWKICGFMCKECTQVFTTKVRLKHHRDTHKQQPVQSQSAPIKDIWCKQCGLYCSSEKTYADHLHICPNNSMYPCVLCPYTFITKVRLGIHYTRKHGKEAFLKHYAPLYNQPTQKTNAPTKSGMVKMYKCPSCRYVNSSYHGVLTHCQMKHQDIVVRAGKLKIMAIDRANFIGCERASNFGGYRCRKCPQVHGALTKLKKHCDVDHNPSTKAPPKQQVVQDNAGSSMSEPAPLTQKTPAGTFRHFFNCSLCSYSTTILKTLGRHYRTRHGKHYYSKYYSPLLHQMSKLKSPFKSVETGLTPNQAEGVKTTMHQLFKCNACSYCTPYRRYLIAHFKNRHKYDSKAVYKQLEKYKNYKSTLPSGQFPCKKCKSMLFESKGRLLTHYRTVHISQMKMDFSILAKRADRTTGIYKCNYCKKKIFGIKNICKHLDNHRERLLKTQSKVSEQQTLPSLNSLAEKAVSASNEGTVVSPSAAASLSNEEPESKDDDHICQRCKRLFKSLKGLRSHERSHAALAALDHATTSESNENVDQYITYRTGTTRPFMCALCSYRTTMSSLAKSHVVKHHAYVLTPKVERLFDEATQKDNEASSNNADDMNADDDELQNSFLEPPDVQRQLKNYSVMARIDLASKTQDLQLRDPRMLPCEMCNFNCQHYSAMRRHCLRRHGKKLIRCKDCNFFSCFKRNLDLHEQMGHSTLQSEPTHQKNLCCPFCLYQSKNKNNMIDHIILHREERVIPMEVRRSKLSRYLQGVVFRCHKCTFSSGSADALHSHVAKHNDLKPFKCRLCYFDCSQMKDLEAHLWDKHQVVRNHQLVGQVSLDLLEAREDRISQDEEEEDMFGTLNNERSMYRNELRNEDQTEDENGSNLEPKIQNLPRNYMEGNLDERANDKMQNGQVQTQSTEDAADHSPMHKDTCENSPQNMEVRMESKNQTAGNTDNSEIVNAVAAVDSNHNSQTNIENTLSEPKLIQVVREDKRKMNETEKTDPYEEMPILEKYFKEQCLVFAQHGETSEKSPCPLTREECNQNRSKGCNAENELQEGHDAPPALLAADGVALVPSPVAANLFPCDYCGRSLANTSELQRHMMRHGM